MYQLLIHFSFILAIYLDPRYQMLLNEEEKTTAITHLVNTWNVLDNLEQAEHFPNGVENDNLGWYTVLLL